MLTTGPEEEEKEVTKRVTSSVYEKHQVLSSVLYEETFDFCHFVFC